MAGKKLDRGNWRGGRADEVSADKENGRGEGMAGLPEMANEALLMGLHEVVACIMENVREGHVQSARLLLELAAKLDKGCEVEEQEYGSLAAQLWKHKQQMDALTEQNE